MGPEAIGNGPESVQEGESVAGKGRKPWTSKKAGSTDPSVWEAKDRLSMFQSALKFGASICEGYPDREHQAKQLTWWAYGWLLRAKAGDTPDPFEMVDRAEELATDKGKEAAQ